MAVVIRMARHGAKKKPIYRVVVADKDFPRDGRFLEVLGTYDPKQPNAKGNLKLERVDYWISKGAKASESVAHILKRTKAS